MNSKPASVLILLGVAFTIAACSGAGIAATATPAPAVTASPNPATPAPATPAPPSGSPSKSPLFPPNSVDPAELDGRTFISQAVADEGVDHGLVPGTDVRITFQGTSLSASAGCNTMSGGYSIADGKLVAAGNWATTEIGCQPALQSQDQWLAMFLSSEPRITLNGNSLVLISGGTAMDMLDKEVAEPDQSLVGTTWTLTSIITGDAVSSVPVGVTATINFGENGRVEVHPGCNSGFGNYVVDGDSITFSDVSITAMNCPGGSQMEVEAAVMAVLNAGTVTFSIDSNSLTLMGGANGLQFSDG